MFTKFDNGTIQNVSTETAVKMMTGSFYEFGMIPSSIVQGFDFWDSVAPAAPSPVIGNTGSSTFSGSYK